MYRIFYAERDTTLYERFPELNSGIDQILELTKNASGSRVDDLVRGETFNTRILIDFGSELTVKMLYQTEQFLRSEIHFHPHRQS